MNTISNTCRQSSNYASSEVPSRAEGNPHATRASNVSSLLGRCLAHFDLNQTYYKIKRGAMIFFSIPLVGIPIGLLVLYEYIKGKRSGQSTQAFQSTEDGAVADKVVEPNREVAAKSTNPFDEVEPKAQVIQFTEKGNGPQALVSPALLKTPTEPKHDDHKGRVISRDNRHTKNTSSVANNTHTIPSPPSSGRAGASKEGIYDYDYFIKDDAQRKKRAVQAFVSKAKANGLTPAMFFKQVTAMMIHAGKDLKISDLCARMSRDQETIIDVTKCLFPEKHKKQLVLGSSKPFEIFLYGYNPERHSTTVDDLALLDHMGEKLASLLSMGSILKFQVSWFGHLASSVELQLESQVQREKPLSRIVHFKRTSENAIRHFEKKRLKQEAQEIFPPSANGRVSKKIAAERTNYVERHLDERLKPFGLDSIEKMRRKNLPKTP